MTTWVYVCVVTTCGHMEWVKTAPAATKRCPKCGGMMRRESAR